MSRYHSIIFGSSLGVIFFWRSWKVQNLALYSMKLLLHNSEDKGKLQQSVSAGPVLPLFWVVSSKAKTNAAKPQQESSNDYTSV